MKHLIYILLFVICILFVIFMWTWFTYQANGAATKEDLQQTEYELKTKIDSVLRECDSLKTAIQQVKADTDTLKSDTDTIKAGMSVIFRTMKENENKNIWDLLW